MDGWTVLQLDERPGEYRVTAQPTRPPTSCPACGSGQLYRFGTRPEVIMDLPMHGKRVGIQAQRRRFRCRSCSKTFVEPTPGVDSHHRATERLVDWIARQSLARTFTNVADEIGLNEITVRRIFNAYTTGGATRSMPSERKSCGHSCESRAMVSGRGEAAMCARRASST